MASDAIKNAREAAHVPSDGNSLDTPNSYPLAARVWLRSSTSEWVLELEGAINDTSFTCRHTQPLSVLPEDVPGLGTLYSQLEQRDRLLEAMDAIRMRTTDPEILRIMDEALASGPDIGDPDTSDMLDFG